MGLFRRSTAETADTTEMRRLVDEVTGLRARLDATEAIDVELQERVQGLNDRLDTPMTPPEAVSVPPPPVSSPGGSAADPDVTDEVDRLRDTVDRMHHDLGELGSRVSLLAERVESVAGELANQLTELGSEIDALAAGAEGETSGTTFDADVIDHLREAQIDLANEQARYQIAFREDLAELAHRLGRRA